MYPSQTHLLWGNLAEEKPWQRLSAVPYSTHRILGINHGQQALQQKCPVPLCQLTDSSSPVAVLQLYLKQNHVQVLGNTPLSFPSSLPNFQVPRPSGKNNDWASKGDKGELVRGDTKNTLPLGIPLWGIWYWATKPRNPLLTTSLRKETHKVWRWSPAQPNSPGWSFAVLISWMGSQGRKHNIAGVPIDRTMSVQNNTLSDRKHLLNSYLIVTQWQHLGILQSPRGSDQPVSGTWEAKSETSQNSCLLRYLLTKSTECLELEFGTNATWLSPRESSKKLVEKHLLSKICSSLRPLY